MKVGDIFVLNKSKKDVRNMTNLVGGIRQNATDNWLWLYRGTFLILDPEACPPGYLERSTNWCLAYNLEQQEKIFLNRSDLIANADLVMKI